MRRDTGREACLASGHTSGRACVAAPEKDCDASPPSSSPGPTVLVTSTSDPSHSTPKHTTPPTSTKSKSALPPATQSPPYHPPVPDTTSPALSTRPIKRNLVTAATSHGCHDHPGPQSDERDAVGPDANVTLGGRALKWAPCLSEYGILRGGRY